MVQGDPTRELMKTLPLSNEEIDIEITVRGSRGEEITVEISRPSEDFSNQTKEKYSNEHLGQDQLWFNAMEDALKDTDYEVRKSTHRSRSRNLYFDGGKIDFDYLEEARIHEVVAKVLNRLDEEIVLERRRRQTEETKTEAAQTRVSDNLLDQLESVHLEE